MATNLHQPPKIAEIQLDPESCSIEVKQVLCKGSSLFLPHNCLSPGNIEIINVYCIVISYRRLIRDYRNVIIDYLP